MKSSAETLNAFPNELANAATRPGLLFWQAVFALTKPTISLLVVITAIPAMLMASPAQLPSMQLVLATLIGIWLASASAAMFNQVLESDVDQQMMRTSRRPIPRGFVSGGQVTFFATTLGVLSLIVLWQWTTPLAALVALAANLFYVVIYTGFLKRRTVQNIVIGGAAGAVGPLIGWAAVSGDISKEAWLLFLLIFLWTPPHFWALALKYKEDYRKAGIPMLPVVYGDEATRQQIFVYSLTLLPLAYVLWQWDAVGLIFALPATLLSVRFAWVSYRLYRSHSNDRAMPVFHFSCLYLFALFGLLTVDRFYAAFY